MLRNMWYITQFYANSSRISILRRFPPVTVCTVTEKRKSFFNTFELYILSILIIYIISSDFYDCIYNLFTCNITMIIIYMYLLSIIKLCKSIVSFIDSKTFLTYFRIKTLVFEYIFTYLKIVNYVFEKLDNNNKNNYCYYYLGKILSSMFSITAILPLFYPFLVLSIILKIIIDIDLVDFINNYFLLMNNGSSGGGPSGNFGGGPSGNFGGGNFGGDPGGNSMSDFGYLRRETNESKRPQGDFPFIPPSEDYMNLLKNVVSPYHYEKISALQRDFPNAKIRDWSALRLFDQEPPLVKVNYYYIDENLEGHRHKPYTMGSFHHNELLVYKKNTRPIHGQTLLLGRQPLPDVGGLFYNAGTKEIPRYTQYDPRIDLERIGVKVIYLDKGVGRGLESIGMHTCSVSRRIIRL